MLVLAVEGGGTNTRGAVFGISPVGGGYDVQVLRQGTEAGTNSRTVGDAVALTRLADLLEYLITGYEGQLTSTCLAMAGPEAVANEAWAALGLNSPVAVVSDVDSGFAAGSLAASGTILIAGTGSVAIRIDGDDWAARGGGWGWLLGDEGGAIWLGREVIRAVLAEIDGVGPATALTEALAKIVGVPTPQVADIIAVIYDRPVVEIGRFARLATSLSATDLVASSIINVGVDHLVQAATLVRAPDEPLVAAGSVANAPEVRGRLEAQLEDLIVVADGVVGAGVLALQAAEVPVSETLHQQMRAAWATIAQ